MSRPNRNSTFDDLGRKLIENRIIDQKTNCWLWTRSTSSTGYGHTWFLGKTYPVHRLALFLYSNLDLRDETRRVRHKKTCPNRTCFNPEHLEEKVSRTGKRDKIKRSQQLTFNF